jgi:type IV secretory pathway VirB10-like protein
MFSNRLAFGALALACVTAAAGGAYLATRQNAQPAAVANIAGAAPVAAPVARPVQETEAVIGEVPKTAEAVPPAVAVPSAPPIRREREETAAPSRAATRPNRSTASTARDNQLPTLQRSWPSGSSSTTPPVSTPPAPPADPPAVAQIEERTAPEPPRAVEPPQKMFEELTVAANSVIGLQTETALSSETARVEDRVEARVVRDVRTSGSVAIPAGSRAIGSVMTVDRGGKFKNQARLGIRFHTLVLADGTRLPITTETIYRYGDPPGQGSATKVGGGAVIGAILGAIAGGAKGAAVGATVGAGAGTATVAAGDRSAATFPAGAEVTARILSPVTVTIEK